MKYHIICALALAGLCASNTTQAQVVVCAAGSLVSTTAAVPGAVYIDNPAIASLGAGIVTGISAGATTITYSDGSTEMLIVDAIPANITGPGSVCVGDTAALSDISAGITWSSNLPGVASVDGSGRVIGISTGVATITVAIATPPHCAIARTISVVSLPFLPGSITGLSSLSVGGTTTLHDTTTGGTWSSTDTSIMKVNSSGLVTAISAGSASIKYTVSNGCGTASATFPMTVSSSTSVSTVLPSGFIQAFPNPAAGDLNIQWGDISASSAEVALSDVTGREVFKDNLHFSSRSGEEKVNLKDVSNGVYILVIRAEGFSYRSKLVIQK